ncbi:MAG TPA: hypothetical protein VFT70_02230 [Nocardioides sp.]|nr:hypothetical protein [Nocardioides sp.]
MSSAPPPPGPPYGYPPPYPPRPQKYRPSGWWFALGIGLFVLAAGTAIGVFVWILAAFLDFDAYVDADGRPHEVTVSTDGDRMLWMDSTAQSCRVIDRETGKPIPLHGVSGHFSRSDDRGDFEGLQKFDPGSGHLEITCVQTDGGAPGTVLISAAPRIGSLVAGILVAIFVPGILGLAGLVVIIVNGILWSTRQPRP